MRKRKDREREREGTGTGTGRGMGTRTRSRGIRKGITDDKERWKERKGKKQVTKICTGIYMEWRRYSINRGRGKRKHREKLVTKKYNG